MNNSIVSEIWESSTPLSISEGDNSQIDGVHVIGRVVGECFFPGGVSRNKRRYSKQLWENTLRKLNESNAFKNRQMMGTVGHGQPLDEKAILEGKITHIVSNMWITDEGKGMGEFLILGTDGGKNLYTLLKAGKKVHFSTRAMGSYSGKDSAGNDVMNESDYSLATVDFVVDPGFLNALPSVVESTVAKPIDSLEDSNRNIDTSKGNSMSDISKEFVEHLKSESAVVKEERDCLLAENIALRAEAAKSTSANEQFNKIQESLDKATSDLAQATAKLEAYSGLGSPEEISESIDRASEGVIKYNSMLEEFGTPDQIRTAFDQATTHIKSMSRQLSKFTDIGSPETFEALVSTSGSTNEEMAKFFEEYGDKNTIASFMTKVESFVKENGSFTDIATALDKTVEFIDNTGNLSEAKLVIDETYDFIKTYGTFGDIKKVMALTEEFIKECGTFNDVRKALDMTSEMLTAQKNKQIEESLTTLSAELGVSLATVKKLHENGLSDDEICNTFKQSRRVTSTHQTSESAPMSGAAYLMRSKPREIATMSVNESNGGLKNRSLASRLMG